MDRVAGFRIGRQDARVLNSQAVLEETDWARLSHAYGPAPESPGMLEALLSDDPEARADAVAFLDGAVLHQGSIYSVTAPAATYVAGILSDPRAGVPTGNALPWDDRVRPLRAALLDWLGRLAESANADATEDVNGDSDDEEQAAIQACRVLGPDLYRLVVPFVADADESVREAALSAVMQLLTAPELANYQVIEAERLERRATDLMEPEERSAIAMVLVRWGLPTRLLADEHPGVRACAALSAGHDGDPAAAAAIRALLLDAGAARSWFEGQPEGSLDQLRLAAIQAMLRRTISFDEVLDIALVLARTADSTTVDYDWGPLLVRAFPGGYAAGQELSSAQRAYLTALVENDKCWPERRAHPIVAQMYPDFQPGPMDRMEMAFLEYMADSDADVTGTCNPIVWLLRAGLPTTRDELRALIA